MKKQNKIEGLLLSKTWFLVSSFIFATGSILFSFLNNRTLAIIYLIIGWIFFMGFQLNKNKKK